MVSYKYCVVRAWSVTNFKLLFHASDLLYILSNSGKFLFMQDFVEMLPIPLEKYFRGFNFCSSCAETTLTSSMLRPHPCMYVCMCKCTWLLHTGSYHLRSSAMSAAPVDLHCTCTITFVLRQWSEALMFTMIYGLPSLVKY